MAQKKMFKRQLTTPVVTVGLIYLSCFILTAGVAQLQLVSAANGSVGFLFYGSAALLFVAPVAIASGLLPALVLHSRRVRTWAVYLANAIVSAMLAAYAFSFNLGVADNLGAILRHIPKNGRDMTDGWIYGAPPFSPVLADAFRALPLIWQEWQFFAGVALAALVIGLVCGELFWSRIVRPAAMPNLAK
jgi:hypothetical protein